MNPLNLIKHLLPRATAWNITINKQLRQFFEGLVQAFVPVFRLFLDLILLDLHPQTTRELSAWETQFAIQDNGVFTEQERRDNLAARWTEKGGQSPRYIQDELQAAGFNVWVHEWWVPNTNPPVARDPTALLTGESTTVWVNECGEAVAECGEVTSECGEPYLVVNSRYPLVNVLLEFENGVFVPVDYTVPTDPARWPFFLYIGAETFPDSATIPIDRKDEFERLCLKLCPCHLWIGALVDYDLGA